MQLGPEPALGDAPLIQNRQSTHPTQDDRIYIRGFVKFNRDRTRLSVGRTPITDVFAPRDWYITRSWYADYRPRRQNVSLTSAYSNSDSLDTYAMAPSHLISNVYHNTFCSGVVNPTNHQPNDLGAEGKIVTLKNRF